MKLDTASQDDILTKVEARGIHRIAIKEDGQMPQQMKKFIDIVNKYNEALIKSQRILLQISQFGTGFESEGVVISHSGHGRPEQYYIPADANLTDDVLKECEGKDGDELLNILTKSGILKKISAQ
ncbi:hypothetical protein [Azospirillum thiophilum]|uniref:hypothetical protein n=1 Tax=Azospirillum thiophilum TaxID=528244 RepID=UPI00118751F5|nr:hypothetical protein [Azospirillum thiophilum]